MNSFQHFEFASFKDFENWKTKEENITNTRFVKERGDDKFIGFVSKTFKCYRSGKYVPSGTGKRYLKVKGSRKINSRCPVKIIAKCFDKGNVSVKYLAHHEGHTNDTTHLFLRKEQRQQIAAKLSLGVPFDDIIDQARKDAGEDVSLQLITKRDLHNIQRTCDLNNSTCHQNDSESVMEDDASLHGLDNSIFHQNESESVMKNDVNNECIGYSEWTEIECTEDESVGEDNIETSVKSTNPNENLLKTVLDTFGQIVNKYKDNPIYLTLLLADIKRADAQLQNIKRRLSDFSKSNVTKE